MTSVRTTGRPAPAPRQPGLSVRGAPSRHSGGAQPSPGSQQALALQNRELIVESLQSSGPATQAGLARSTGLSAATVSNVVGRLRHDGRVRTGYTVSAGRRAVLVQLTDAALVSAGFELTTDALHAVLMRPGGVILARSKTPINGVESLPALTDSMTGTLTTLLGRAECGNGSLGAAGIALPGLLGPGPGWMPGCLASLRCTGAEIQAAAETALGVPVSVAASSTMAAFAYSCRRNAAEGALMFLSVDSAVTAGFVIGDEPYSGHTGLAGQIGHVRVSDYGLPCRCGNRGCLDTLGSLPAILAAYAAGHPPVTTEGFLAKACAGDPAALRIVEDAAEALGLAAAGAASIINPRQIVLGGPLCALGPALLEPFRRSLVRTAGPGIGDAAEISLNTLGADISATGAAHSAARLITGS